MLQLVIGLIMVGTSCFMVECQPVTFTIVSGLGGWLIGGLHIYVEKKGPDNG